MFSWSNKKKYLPEYPSNQELWNVDKFPEFLCCLTYLKIVCIHSTSKCKTYESSKKKQYWPNLKGHTVAKMCLHLLIKNYNIF